MCNLVIFFSTSFRGPTIYTAFYRSTIDFPVHRETFVRTEQIFAFAKTNKQNSKSFSGPSDVEGDYF